MPKITTFLFAFLAFLSFYNISNGQQITWAEHIKAANTGSALMQANALARDGQGNIYLAGRISDTTDFGGNIVAATGPIPGVGTPDGYIAKYNASGSIGWVITFESPINATINDMVCDAAGNTYVTGTFDTEVNIGATSLSGTGRTDMFVAKLDATGNVQWAKSTAAVAGAFVNAGAIALGRNNDLFLSGSFEKKVNFLGTVLDISSKGTQQFYFGRMRQDGTPLWFVEGGSIMPTINSMAVTADAASNGYFTGSITDTATFDTIFVDATGAGTFFLAKYDSTGRIQWIRTGGKSGARGAGVVGHPSTNEVYVTGSFQDDTFKIGNVELVAALSCCEDFFIAKFDGIGNLQWARQSHGNGAINAGNGIAANTDGSVMVSGIFGGIAPAASFDLVLGENANEIILANGGGMDGFVARYSSSGDVQWAAAASGLETDNAKAVASDGANTAFISGEFVNNIMLGDTAFTSVPSSSVTNIYIAAFDGGQTSSIMPKMKTAEVLLYPNPVQRGGKYVLMETPNLPNEVRVYSLAGHVLQKEVLLENSKLYFNGLNQGIYFIKLRIGEDVVVKKLIVQ